MTRNILIILVLMAEIVSSNNVLSQKLLDTSNKSFFEIVNNAEKLITDTSDIPILDKESGLIREDLYYRWEWFWSSRIDKNGQFEEYGRQLRKAIIEENKPKVLKSASSTNWTALGPSSAPSASCSSVTRSTGLTQVTSVWANASNLYVGLNGGGLWKKNGSTWDNLTDDVASFSVLDIEVDNSGKIYLATGWDGQGGSLKENDLYGMGVIYSTNGGSAWVTDRMTSVPDEDLLIEKILLHPTGQDTLYALSRSTVYKSTNGAYTWTDTQAPSLSNNDFYTNMVFKENDPTTIYICSAGRNSELGTNIIGCIYKSTNGGTSWQTSNLVDNVAYSTHQPHWIDIATTADDPSAIYVVYEDTASVNTTLERSTDGGSNWTTLVDQDNITARSYMLHTLAISPDDKDDIFIGSVWQYKYDDINDEFDRIGSNLHDDLRDFYFVNSGGTLTIYQGNDAGIYSSTNGGSTWTDLSSGIQGSLFYDIAISEEDTEKYLGGVGDCGTHYYNGTTWSNMCIGGDGGTCLINDHNTSNMYAMANKNYYYTKNSGSTWSTTGQKSVGYNKPIVMHPTSNKIYLATANDGWWHRVRVSSNNGDTWSDYSDSWANDRIMAMAISESDPDYFYLTKVLYTTNGTEWTQTTTIVRSTDDGDNWTDITSGLGTITGEAKMQHIEIHPEDPDNVWVSFGGLSSGKKIYVTEDGGSSWTNISYNLPNLPHSKIEYYNGTNILYVTNDIGVYYLEDGETSWTRMGDFPYAITTGLELNHESGKLYAATWGRGLWETDFKGHCYDETSLTISSPTTWTTDRELCQDLVISSSYLSIQCKVTLPFDAKITVEDGATLTIYGGTVVNADIIVEDGGLLELEDVGSVKLKNEDLVKIEDGGLLDLDSGEILPIAQ